MNRGRTILLGLACIAVVAALLARNSLFKSNDEPVYHGHRLSWWVEKLGNSSQDDPDNEAMQAISKIGMNALPYFLNWMRYEPQPARIKDAVKSVLGEIPVGMRPGVLLRWAYQDKEALRADTAATAFSLLGAETRSAIPELCNLMNNRSSTNASFRATYVLARIGTDALPCLLSALTNSSPQVRRHVAGLFGQVPTLTTNAASAVPLLVQCLQDKDPRLPDIAAWSLGRIALKPDICIPALTNCLHNSSTPLLQVRSLYALSAYGGKARTATPTLLAALHSSDGEVRRAATNAILKIMPEALTNALSLSKP